MSVTPSKAAPNTGMTHGMWDGESGDELDDEVTLLRPCCFPSLSFSLGRRIDDILLRVRREWRHVERPLCAVFGIERKSLPRGQVEDVFLHRICASSYNEDIKFENMSEHESVIM